MELLKLFLLQGKNTSFSTGKTAGKSWEAQLPAISLWFSKTSQQVASTGWFQKIQIRKKKEFSPSRMESRFGGSFYALHPQTSLGVVPV